MKKLTISAIMMLLSLALLCSATFAWQQTLSEGYYTSSNLHIGVGSSKGIKISTADGVAGSNSYTSSLSSASLIPCTSDDGISFYVDGSTTPGVSILNPITDLSGYVYQQTLYVTSDTEYSKIWISSITISGDGAQDTINKALRVALYTPYGCVLYNPSSMSTNKISAYFGQSSLQITIKIWYDGADENCTYANSESATGNIQVKITLSAE